MIGSLTIRAGGIAFRGHPGATPDHGFFIVREGVTGLNGAGVGIERESARRQGAHGTLYARGWRDGRMITIRGLAVARSMAELAKMADQFAGCLADGYDAPIVATLYDGTTREYFGGLASTPEWQELSGGFKASFLIQFWCGDPRAYGERRAFTQSTPGPLEVYNRGNFEARPVVSALATAAMGGYQFKLFDGTEQLGNLRMNAIATGHLVAVDMASGRCTLNGVPTNGLIYSGDRWHIPYGRSYDVVLESGGVTGSALLGVTFRDPFI
ncbi:phage tail domain-containing protein [Pseudoclavibacter sp. 8L]|uniref:phage tail domain-containing protein n=1 Tax=Pseudoclavibacter sp. 8L TaxID=2653162 RepID=UPI0012F0A592|nr:phage tail domain-containing protein [Pseudoclavibacter sp. 8L]VXB32686.1 conserved hypothetical protein [Pseudoclavibacter sp. 8L]